MKLFDVLYNRAHKEEGPRPLKKGILRFFQIIWIEFWNLILLNMLYVVFCLPVVTIPAATAAFTAELCDMVRDRPRMLVHRFWSVFKREFRQATLLGCIGLLILAFLLGLLTAVLFFLPPLFTYLLLPATAIVLFLFCMAWIYVYPLLVITDLPLRHILRNAVSLSLLCAKHAAAAVIVCGFIAYYALLYFPVSIPFLLFGVLSLLGLVCTFAAWAGIRDHVVAEALQKAKTSLLDDADEWAAIWNS